MKFELCKIDPNTSSLEDIKKEINRLNNLKEEYNGIQNSIKEFINSIYGACASPYFDGFNLFVAEAVTLQGQNIIKYGNKTIDDYFLNYWHLDKELHKALGLTYVNKINEKTLIVYNDTDSLFINFGTVIKSCDVKGSPLDFILKIKKLRLDNYIKHKFDEYAKSFNTENLQSLELEKISYSALMVAKKKYILDLAWKDPGVRFKPQEQIKPTGIELIQGSTPKFVRTILKELLNLVFKKGKEIEYVEIIHKLRELKRQFVLQNPNDIAITKSIGDYEKYILEDRKNFKIESKCPINVRAAGVYNYMLLNSKYRSKYNLLKTSDKVKYYYSKGEHDIFGFIPGIYPYEFALDVNYDLQFEKTVIEPFNRYIESLGFQHIPANLVFAKKLF